MKGERKIFLEFSANNKGNGYYPRTITNGSFKLNVDVLRDRKGEFSPHILPEPCKRVDEGFERTLASDLKRPNPEGASLELFPLKRLHGR